MTRRVRSHQSAKEWATTRPLVWMMSQRTSHLRQRERRQPNLLMGDVESYAEGGEEVKNEGEDEVEEGKKRSGSDGDDVDGDEDDDDSDEESSEGTSEGPGNNRPFILPED